LNAGRTSERFGDETCQALDAAPSAHPWKPNTANGWVAHIRNDMAGVKLANVNVLCYFNRLGECGTAKDAVA
jgi:hypothetical protein